MSHKHNVRSKNKRRERLFPERFVAGVATGSWSHYEQGPHRGARKRERLVLDNPALAEQIREGVEEAETGRTVYLGSFLQDLSGSL